MELHWFIDPLKNHYADFEGRVTRQTYWMFSLFTLLIILVLDFIGSFTDVEYISDIFSLAIFLPSIGLGARRLHDIGMSGWMQAIGLIPILGWIVIIYFLAKQGETGPNVYGNDPRAVATPISTPIPTPSEPTTTA